MKFIRTTPAMLAITCTALTLAGCSSPAPDPGSQDGEKGVKTAVEAWGDALQSRDGNAACSFMSATAQRTIESKYSKPTCPDAVSALPPTGLKEPLANLADATITIDGDTATIAGTDATTVAQAIGTDTLQLKKVEGRWHIS